MTGRRTIEYLPLDVIQRADNNPKGHADAEIRASFDEFGFVEPIVIDERTQQLVAGHSRLEQLQWLRARAGKTGRAKGGPPEGIVLEGGDWLAPVVRGWSSADDDQAAAYLVTANKLTEAGGWDERPLAALLSDLEERRPDLARVTGFRDVELAEMIERLAADVTPAAVAGGNPEVAPPVPTEPLSRTGDLFELGPHRLIVGDATDPTVIARLMDGQRAACLWTDPPYGVDYQGGGPRRLKIANDTPDKAILLFARILEAIVDAGALSPGAAYYVAHPDGDLSIDFRHLLRQAPWRYKQTLIWRKDALVLGRSDYHYEHEPIAHGELVAGDVVLEHEAIAYGAVGGRTKAGRMGKRGRGWFGSNAATTVFEISRPRSSRLHPTMKPIELVAAHLANSTRRGHLVLDTCAGSGSTLLACHTLGRVGRLVELDPGYADVICRRWTHVTGQPALRDGAAVPFPPLTPEEAGS